MCARDALQHARAALNVRDYYAIVFPYLGRGLCRSQCDTPPHFTTASFRGECVSYAGILLSHSCEKGGEGKYQHTLYPRPEFRYTL
jgi:hypothetical protein